jgi:hypothetical protein
MAISSDNDSSSFPNIDAKFEAGTVHFRFEDFLMREEARLQQSIGADCRPCKIHNKGQTD